jgi:hypothetical protein
MSRFACTTSGWLFLGRVLLIGTTLAAAAQVALSGGGYREVFRQQVLRYEIEPGEGARTIRFDLHGTHCGKTGPEPCSKRRRIGTRPFELTGPF